MATLLKIEPVMIVYCKECNRVISHSIPRSWSKEGEIYIDGLRKAGHTIKLFTWDQSSDFKHTLTSESCQQKHQEPLPEIPTE